MKSMLFVLCGMLLSVTQETPFQQLQQLQGRWKMETSRRTIYEQWSPGGKTAMAGWSYMLRGADTVTLEKITLMENKEGVFYVPAVANQNQGQAVAFRLISAAGRRFVFENKEHDFPQRIIYQLVNSDSVHAWIEGTKDGAARRSDFYYSRVK